MTIGKAYWKEGLSRAEVVRVLADHWADGAFCQLEKVEAVKLDNAGGEWLSELKSRPELLWQRGRVFHSTAEVRWEPCPNGPDRFRAMLVAEDAIAPPGDGWSTHHFDEVRENRVLLWGERRPGDHYWREERIPNPLAYPVEWTEEKTMAAIETRDYFQSGVIRLTRFVRVVSIPRPEVKP